MVDIGGKTVSGVISSLIPCSSILVRSSLLVFMNNILIILITFVEETANPKSVYEMSQFMWCLFHIWLKL